MFDSASEYHRTYERAPPATLGSVVPLLAYPLAIPMSQRAKRNDLDHAVRHLNAAIDFLTGAGGFLQQVIYGYTGLRLGDDGVSRAFPPLLPSGITRLELRDFHIRGSCYDIIVENDQLRMSPRACASSR
jgi:trehalose/maltose hydrolase-like predicted phosphorylase